MDAIRRYGLLRFWLFCLGLALCVIFAGLAVFGASIAVILCIGFPVLVVSIWFLAWELYAIGEDLPFPYNRLQEISEQLRKLTEIAEAEKRQSESQEKAEPR